MALHAREPQRNDIYTRQAGLTALEIAVGIVLVALIAIILGRLLLTTQGLVVDAAQRDELVERSRRVIDDLELELMVARVHGIETLPSGYPSIVYTLPIDIGEDANGNGILDTGEDTNGNGQLDRTDGDAVSATGQIEWGCLEQGEPRLDRPSTPHRIRLSFEPGETVSEATLGADINGDGDRTDAFVRGGLVRTTSDGDQRMHGGTMLLLGADDPAADRNGDGVADPLFSVTGEGFTDSDSNGVRSGVESFSDSNGNNRWDGFWRLHLTFFTVDAQENPQVLQLVREVAPRNPQE